MLGLCQPVPGVQIVGTAKRGEYSVNAEYFAPHLVSEPGRTPWSEHLGNARSFFSTALF